MLKRVATWCGCSILLLGSVRAEDWPQWRGPSRDDKSTESGLLKEWPPGGPEKLWESSKAGLGYSGFSTVGGTLFTMGAVNETTQLIALDANTGAKKWSTPIGPQLENGYGDGPRGTPTVDGDHVYALSGTGILVCADVADGQLVWKTSLPDFGGKEPNWGYSESVLVDGGQVVCTPGGKQGAMLALDKTNGKLLWQSKDFTEGAQYASIIPATIHGQKQYIQLTQALLVGISAEDGSLLWSTPWQGRTAVIPTPIVDGDSIYISSGYGAGCKMIRVNADGEVIDVYDNQIMKNHHGGVVHVGDYLYGYSDGLGWVCQNFATGELVWNEKNALGKGAIAYADGMLYCLEESSGKIMLVEASPQGWQAHGQFTLEPQSDQRSPKGKVWVHPVISNGKLYLRDQEIICCYDVRA